MVLITKRMMVTSRTQLARSHHRFLTPRLGLRADSAWFRDDGPQKEGPMWMMQQPVLPASPRAVTNVPKAVRNSSGLSSARHNREEDEFDRPLLVLSFREKKSLLQ